MKTIVITVVILAILCGGGWLWYSYAHNTVAVGFKTTEVQRGDITSVISATATVEPEEVIDVGAQVQGEILSFGTDKSGKPIDYDSQVEAGTVLAHIDDAVYASDVASAKAALALAKADVVKSQADLNQSKAKLFSAQRDWERAQQIDPKSNALAQTQYDAYESAYEAAKAQVDVSAAGLTESQTNVDAAQANLDRANRNEGYCTIISPVKGTIIDRRVNVGQTVVASLNTPSLFLIAKDLTRMQVWASVNEADIGNIKSGQQVSFTVDAFPDRKFKGTVNKVRLNATMTQNVVTYTVEVNADNSDGTLLPYLTANVSFHVDSHRDVLVVPNAALRWAPSDVNMIAPDAREAAANEAATGQSGGHHGNGQHQAGANGAANGNANAANTETAQAGEKSVSNEKPIPSTDQASVDAHRHYRDQARARTGGTATSQPTTMAGSDRPQHGTLWVEDGTFVRPVHVRLGLTDGTNTEVIADSLKEGTPVVIGEATADSGNSDDARNPFAPHFSSHRSGSH